MASNLYTKEFLDQIVLLITTLSPIGGGSLGLKICMGNSLRYFGANTPTLQTLEMPACLVEPADANFSLDPVDLVANYYEVTYRYKITLIYSFSSTEKPLDTKLAMTKALVGFLTTNINVFIPPDVNCQVLYNVVENIDFTPPEEDDIYEMGKTDVWVSTVTLAIATQTQRV